MDNSLSEMDEHYMTLALEEARAAALRGEVPIGAVMVDPRDRTVIARDGNRTIELKDPSAHAEILCIREACGHFGAQRIPELELYVTLEPCAMCAAALSFARVKRVIFGALDVKGGGVLHGGCFYEQPTCHHKPLIKNGLFADDSAKILKQFFKARR